MLGDLAVFRLIEGEGNVAFDKDMGIRVVGDDQRMAVALEPVVEVKSELLHQPRHEGE